MKECESCGGDYFKEPHYCVPGREPATVTVPRNGFAQHMPETPGGWPYYYKKLPGMSEQEAKQWSLDEAVKEGKLERIEVKAYRTGRVNSRYIRQEAASVQDV